MPIDEKITQKKKQKLFQIYIYFIYIYIKANKPELGRPTEKILQKLFQTYQKERLD